MNWLTPLHQQIAEHRWFSEEARGALTLWASELSGICDVSVPRAPVPQLDQDTEERTLELTWFDQGRHRAISVTVEECDLSVSIHLLDRDKAHTILRPTHDQLKSSVRSFFEGWMPHA